MCFTWTALAVCCGCCRAVCGLFAVPVLSRSPHLFLSMVLIFPGSIHLTSGLLRPHAPVAGTTTASTPLPFSHFCDSSIPFCFADDIPPSTLPYLYLSAFLLTAARVHAVDGAVVRLRRS